MIIDILEYVEQMIPLGLVALTVFFLFRPMRQRKLNDLNLSSSGLRELALALSSQSVGLCL